jgi:hypothetical protein
VIVPGAMTFIAFVSHMRVLGGVPLTQEVLSVLVGGLVVLVYSYILLWGAASNARELAIAAYKKDILNARRCHSRLASFIGAGELPVQDDKEILKSDFKDLVDRSSAIVSGYDVQSVDVENPMARKDLSEYLVSLIERHEETIEQLGDLRSGVLTPLQLSPIVGALLVPVAGTGGLSVVQWLLSM